MSYWRPVTRQTRQNAVTLADGGAAGGKTSASSRIGLRKRRFDGVVSLPPGVRPTRGTAGGSKNVVDLTTSGLHQRQYDRKAVYGQDCDTGVGESASGWLASGDLNRRATSGCADAAGPDPGLVVFLRTRRCAFDGCRRGSGAASGVRLSAAGQAPGEGTGHCSAAGLSYECVGNAPPVKG